MERKRNEEDDVCDGAGAVEDEVDETHRKHHPKEMEIFFNRIHSRIRYMYLLVNGVWR